MTNLIDIFEELTKHIKGDWFVSDGALLGLTRNGELIPWDKDIDIYLLPGSTIDLSDSHLEIQEYYMCDKVYDPCNPKEKLNTWKEYCAYKRCFKEFTGLNRCKLYKKIKWDYPNEKILPEFTSPNIDVFYLYKKDDKYYSKGDWVNGEPIYYTEDDIKIRKNNDLGFTINIPNNAEEILERQYGKNWKIPDENFKYFNYIYG